MMSTNVGVHTATAAARRRQRRLRSWLRHERMTVAMTLAEKLHHTSRGLKIARVGEEAGLETHSGLRAPTPLPPGMRPEPLSEPLHWFITGLEALFPTGRLKWWTPPSSASSRLLRWRPEGREEEREEAGGAGRNSTL